MIEGQDQTSVTINKIPNTKIWVPNEKGNYKEILDTFFPNGVKFNGNIFIKKQTFPRNTQLVTTTLGIKPELLNVRVGVSIILKSTTNFIIRMVLGPSDVLYDSFEVDIVNKSIIRIQDNEPILIDSFGFNFDTSEFNVVFTGVNDANYYNFSLIGFTQADYLKTTEYIVRDPNLRFLPETHADLPQMDSLDLCNFLWQAQKGIVTSNTKIFNSEMLINNNFSEIDTFDMVSFKSPSLETTKFNTILNETKNGDIYLFDTGQESHALFIIDIDRKYYTEVSSKIEWELGAFYNAKINPYEFESRIKNLAINNSFYRIRLN